MGDSVSTPPWRAADRQNGSRTRTIAAHLADTGVTDEEELEEVVVSIDQASVSSPHFAVGPLHRRFGRFRREQHQGGIAGDLDSVETSCQRKEPFGVDGSERGSKRTTRDSSWWWLSECAGYKDVGAIIECFGRGRRNEKQVRNKIKE